MHFPTHFVHSSTSVEASHDPESGGRTLFDPLSFATTPSHLAAPLPSPKPALHSNADLAKALDCTRIILAPRHRAAARARAKQNALEKWEVVVFAAFVFVFIFHLR